MAIMRPARHHVSASRTALADGVNSPCHGFTGGVQANQKHVLRKPIVIPILWDDFFTSHPDAVTAASNLLSDLVTGSFMNGLAQYGVSRGSVQNPIVLGSTANPPNATTWDISGTNDQDQLTAFLNNGTVTPKPDVDEVAKVYLIFTPQSLKLTSGTNPGVCGWHKHTKFNQQSSQDDLFWAVVSTNSANSPIDTTSGQTFVNSVAYCVSHELAEAFTNRDGQGYHVVVDMQNDDCEIGDICEFNGGTAVTTYSYLGRSGVSWNIESMWSQWDNKCIHTDGPISLKTFLKAINFDFTRGLLSLNTKVINADFVASKF